MSISVSVKRSCSVVEGRESREAVERAGSDIMRQNNQMDEAFVAMTDRNSPMHTKLELNAIVGQAASVVNCI